MDKQKEKGDLTKYDFSGLQQWLEQDLSFPLGVASATNAEVQFHCARCRTSWSCPALNAEHRREVADLVRRKHVLEPFAYLRSVGFTFASAKPTVLHISIAPGKCHKCKRGLSGDSEQVVCRCRSPNLNW